MRARKAWLSSVLVALNFGCGGSVPPPETPVAQKEPTPAEPAAQAPEPEEEETAEQPAGEATGEEATEPPADEQARAPAAEPPPTHSHGMKPTHPPSEILTGAKVSFMINYSSSAPKKAAEERCTEESGEDFEARAKCMGEARKEFLADVMVFKKEGGQIWWTIYRRDRANLFEVSKSQVQLTDETEDSVTLKLVGKGTGARPLFTAAQQVVVKVPNDSSLELNDPKLGSLLYEAKIGLVGD